MKDRYGVEIERGDECIVCKYNKVFKVKIHDITEWTIQYLIYDGTDYVKRKPIDYSMAHISSNHNTFIVKVC